MLVLAPTRELAMQTAQVAVAAGNSTGYETNMNTYTHCTEHYHVVLAMLVLAPTRELDLQTAQVAV